MVAVIIGDMFESKAQTLVNTVNCVGVMGKGVALEFKKRFPDMYEDYVQRCRKGQVRLGRPYLYGQLIPPWIVNFPTKDHWRSVSRLEDIIRGLEYLEQHYQEWGITSIALPPLGCGQGQLEWRVVGPTLYRHLKRLTIPVELYAPFGTPHEELQPAFLDIESAAVSVTTNLRAPMRINPGWVALVALLDQIEQEPYHWPVGRTTLQKIAYFATEAGIPTGLQHHRGSFGPFAPDLKGVITRLVNNGLIREERLGQMFAVRVGPTFRDAYEAYKPQLEQWAPIIDRLTDLFVRMRTNDAELAATVHFASKQLESEGPEHPSEGDVLAAVLKWKERRRPPLDEEAAALAIRSLGMLGWLSASPSEDLPLTEETALGV